MASEIYQKRVHFTPVGPAGRDTWTHGIATLAAGTLELDTGLSLVRLVVANYIAAPGADITVHTIIGFEEDFPVQGGVVTCRGITLDIGSNPVAGVAQQFSWMAFGDM